MLLQTTKFWLSSIPLQACASELVRFVPLLLLAGGLSFRTACLIWRFLLWYWKNFHRSRMRQAGKTRRFLLQMRRTRELQSNCLSPSVWLKPWSSISDPGWWNTGLLPKEGKLHFCLMCSARKAALGSCEVPQRWAGTEWVVMKDCSVAFHKPPHPYVKGLQMVWILPKTQCLPHLLLPQLHS